MLILNCHYLQIVGYMKVHSRLSFSLFGTGLVTCADPKDLSLLSHLIQRIEIRCYNMTRNGSYINNPG